MSFDLIISLMSCGNDGHMLGLISLFVLAVPTLKMWRERVGTAAEEGGVVGLGNPCR